SGSCAGLKKDRIVQDFSEGDRSRFRALLIVYILVRSKFSTHGRGDNWQIRAAGRPRCRKFLAHLAPFSLTVALRRARRRVQSPPDRSPSWQRYLSRRFYRVSRSFG